jgi:hypothetical protein
VGLKLPGFGQHGLRALLSYGKTPGHHQVLVCVVPALQLSFCLGTNASCLGDSAIQQLVTDVVGTCVESVKLLENTQMQTATIYSPILNQQLSEAPPPCTHNANHHVYCRGKQAVVSQRDPRVDLYCGGEEFISLTDAQEDFTSTVKLQVRCETKGAGKVYLLVEKYAHGEHMSHALAYDPDCIRDSSTASQVFAAVQQGRSVDRRLTGLYAFTLDPFLIFPGIARFALIRGCWPNPYSSRVFASMPPAANKWKHVSSASAGECLCAASSLTCSRERCFLRSAITFTTTLPASARRPPRPRNCQ